MQADYGNVSEIIQLNEETLRLYLEKTKKVIGGIKKILEQNQK